MSRSACRHIAEQSAVQNNRYTSAAERAVRMMCTEILMTLVRSIMKYTSSLCMYCRGHVPLRTCSHDRLGRRSWVRTEGDGVVHYVRQIHVYECDGCQSRSNNQPGALLCNPAEWCVSPEEHTAPADDARRAESELDRTYPTS